MKRILLISSILTSNISQLFAAEFNQPITALNLIAEVIKNPPTIEQLHGIRPADLLSEDGLTEIAQSDEIIGPIDLYAYCVVTSKFIQLRRKRKELKTVEVINTIKRFLETSAGEAQYLMIYENQWLPAYYAARRAAMK